MKRLPAFPRRLQPFLEAMAVALVAGLIDVHVSRIPPSSWLAPAYIVACAAMGFRHAGRGAWQCWIALGVIPYIVHLAAIGCGFQPPFVEADALAARRSLLAFVPVTFGLCQGVLLRVTLSAAGISRRNGETAKLLPRTTLGLLGLVAWSAFVIVVLKWVVVDSGTAYAPGFAEGRFRQVEVGMPTTRVEALIGRPLRKEPTSPDVDVWYYSRQVHPASDYHQRMLFVKDGQVERVVSDYWID